MIIFDPQPSPAERPARFPSPFDDAPHPLARRAAAELIARLPAAMAEGKMFGVLVVAAGAEVGWLRAFSGMLDGSWHVDGFAPPVFDVAARDAFWRAGERVLAELGAEIDQLALVLAPVRAEQAALEARQAAELAELRARHRANRDQRHASREQLERARDVASGGALALDPLGGGDAHALDQLSRGAAQHALDPLGRRGAAQHALDQLSRGDTAEDRRLRAAHRDERAALDAMLQPLVARRDALDAERTARSRGYLRAIHDGYSIANASGERRALTALFAPGPPPGGAGDCAGPKLLAQAYRDGLRPIALAELWWGPPPVTGGRHAGVFYPACRGKCGPILAHMVDGLDAVPPPVFGAAGIAADEPRIVYEDCWLAIVDKPCGLLSVPGRHASLRDSVATRLGGRFVAHRLDLDTSGLMIVASDRETHAALQRMFAERAIDKRYIAWLDGDVAGERGTIELALRVDLDDRPRQIVDPIHGKHAVTEWAVVARHAGRTRVALIPRTGRTHQLRVHAAHPRGLGVPIAGDRLYGRSGERGERLMLHAEALAFVHPHTGARVVVERMAPF